MKNDELLLEFHASVSIGLLCHPESRPVEKGRKEGKFPPTFGGPRRRITALHIVDVQRSNPYNFRLLQSA